MDQLTERVKHLEDRADYADEARQDLERSLLEELGEIKGAIHGLTKSVGDFAQQLLSQNTRNDLQDTELAELRTEVRKLVKEYLDDLKARAASIGKGAGVMGGIGTVLWAVAELVRHFGGGA